MSSGAEELSLVFWILALGGLGQEAGGLECESPVKEVVGGMGSGLVGLYTL